ncbi:MAG: DUF983 domain-containing protein [Acidimicrobiia bacterium]
MGSKDRVENRVPSRLRIIWWGLTLRCPRCGSGHLFRRYFQLVDDCPKCDLHFEREAGYFAGALAINIICVGGLFAIVFVSLLVVTIPEIPVVPILAVVVPIVVIGPIVWYPFSKTLWMAVDRAFLQRLDAKEQLDERGPHR